MDFIAALVQFDVSSQPHIATFKIKKREIKRGHDAEGIGIKYRRWGGCFFFFFQVDADRARRPRVENILCISGPQMKYVPLGQPRSSRLHANINHKLWIDAPFPIGAPLRSNTIHSLRLNTEEEKEEEFEVAGHKFKELICSQLWHTKYKRGIWEEKNK